VEIADWGSFGARRSAAAPYTGCEEIRLHSEFFILNSSFEIQSTGAGGADACDTGGID
jgi:hypothetical protein